MIGEVVAYSLSFMIRCGLSSVKYLNVFFGDNLWLVICKISQCILCCCDLVWERLIRTQPFFFLVYFQVSLTLRQTPGPAHLHHEECRVLMEALAWDQVIIIIIRIYTTFLELQLIQVKNEY